MIPYVHGPAARGKEEQPRQAATDTQAAAPGLPAEVAAPVPQGPPQAREDPNVQKAARKRRKLEPGEAVDQSGPERTKAGQSGPERARAVSNQSGPARAEASRKPGRGDLMPPSPMGTAARGD